MAIEKKQEAQILARYLHKQPENGNSDTSVQGADFLIDKEYGCLGASPVSVVTDNSSKGCAEIKDAVSYGTSQLQNCKFQQHILFKVSLRRNFHTYLFFHECKV